MIKNNELSKVHDVTQLSQLLVVVTIPLSILANNITIVIWFICILYEKIKKPEKHKFLKEIYQVRYFILLYLIIVLSVFTSQELSHTFTVLEKRLSIALIPLLFAASSKPNYTLLHKAFAYTVLLLCIIALLTSIYKNLVYSTENNLTLFRINPYFFSNQLLSNNVGLHATYFSVYIIFSLSRFLKWRKINSNSDYIIAAFLIATLMLLSSRVCITYFLLYSISYLLFGLISKKQKLIISALLIAVILIGISNPVTISRFKSFYSNSDNSHSGLSLRFKIWHAVYDDLIKKNIIFGIGTDHVKSKLISTYNKNNLEDASKHIYNSHNQYLDILLLHGLTGAILLVVILFEQFKYAFRLKKYEHLVFITLILTVFITESFLHKQKGIVFFSYFASMALMNKKLN